MGLSKSLFSCFGGGSNAPAREPSGPQQDAPKQQHAQQTGTNSPFVQKQQPEALPAVSPPMSPRAHPLASAGPFAGAHVVSLARKFSKQLSGVESGSVFGDGEPYMRQSNQVGGPDGVSQPLHQHGHQGNVASSNGVANNDSSSANLLKQSTVPAGVVVFSSPADLVKDVQDLRYLGQGAQGVVYEGVWQGATVAVKFTIAEKLDTSAYELLFSKILSHPNVVQTFLAKVAVLDDLAFQAKASPRAGSSQPLHAPMLHNNALCAAGYAPTEQPAGADQNSRHKLHQMQRRSSQGSPALPPGNQTAAATAPAAAPAAAGMGSSAAAVQTTCRPNTGDGHGDTSSADNAAAAAAAAAAAGGAAQGSLARTESLRSDDGFGDPYGRKSTFTDVREVLSAMGGRPGHYITQMVMELCDHGSLHTAIHKGLFKPSSRWGPKLAMRALVRTAREIAQGMLHLHSNQVLHGDLKPANVLLTNSRKDRRGYVAKVSDFGLAQLCPSNNDHISNAPWGTLMYMAPERLLYGQLFPSSDIYSFGVVLWEMYHATRPFEGLHAAQIVVAAAQGNVLLDWAPGAPEDLVLLAKSCMNPNQALRPTCEELMVRLTQLEARVRLDGIRQSSESRIQSRLSLESQPSASIARHSIDSRAAAVQQGQQNPGSGRLTRNGTVGAGAGTGTSGLMHSHSQGVGAGSRRRSTDLVRRSTEVRRSMELVAHVQQSHDAIMRKSVEIRRASQRHLMAQQQQSRPHSGASSLRASMELPVSPRIDHAAYVPTDPAIAAVIAAANKRDRERSPFGGSPQQQQQQQQRQQSQQQLLPQQLSGAATSGTFSIANSGVLTAGSNSMSSVSRQPSAQPSYDVGPLQHQATFGSHVVPLPILRPDTPAGPVTPPGASVNGAQSNSSAEGMLTSPNSAANAIPSNRASHNGSISAAARANGGSATGMRARAAGQGQLAPVISGVQQSVASVTRGMSASGSDVNETFRGVLTMGGTDGVASAGGQMQPPPLQMQSGGVGVGAGAGGGAGAVALAASAAAAAVAAQRHQQQLDHAQRQQQEQVHRMFQSIPDPATAASAAATAEVGVTSAPAAAMPGSGYPSALAIMMVPQHPQPQSQPHSQQTSGVLVGSAMGIQIASQPGSQVASRASAEGRRLPPGAGMAPGVGGFAPVTYSEGSVGRLSFDCLVVPNSRLSFDCQAVRATRLSLDHSSGRRIASPAPPMPLPLHGQPGNSGLLFPIRPTTAGALASPTVAGPPPLMTAEQKALWVTGERNTPTHASGSTTSSSNTMPLVLIRSVNVATAGASTSAAAAAIAAVAVSPRGNDSDGSGRRPRRNLTMPAGGFTQQQYQQFQFQQQQYLHEQMQLQLQQQQQQQALQMQHHHQQQQQMLMQQHNRMQMQMQMQQQAVGAPGPAAAASQYLPPAPAQPPPPMYMGAQAGLQQQGPIMQSHMQMQMLTTSAVSGGAGGNTLSAPGSGSAPVPSAAPSSSTTCSMMSAHSGHGHVSPTASSHQLVMVTASSNNLMMMAEMCEQAQAQAQAQVAANGAAGLAAAAAPSVSASSEVHCDEVIADEANFGASTPLRSPPSRQTSNNLVASGASSRHGSARLSLHFSPGQHQALLQQQQQGMAVMYGNSGTAGGGRGSTDSRPMGSLYFNGVGMSRDGRSDCASLDHSQAVTTATGMVTRTSLDTPQPGMSSNYATTAMGNSSAAFAYGANNSASPYAGGWSASGYVYGGCSSPVVGGSTSTKAGFGYGGGSQSQSQSHGQGQGQGRSGFGHSSVAAMAASVPAGKPTIMMLGKNGAVTSNNNTNGAAAAAGGVVVSCVDGDDVISPRNQPPTPTEQDAQPSLLVAANAPQSPFTMALGNAINASVANSVRNSTSGAIFGRYSYTNTSSNMLASASHTGGFTGAMPGTGTGTGTASFGLEPSMSAVAGAGVSGCASGHHASASFAQQPHSSSGGHAAGMSSGSNSAAAAAALQATGWLADGPAPAPAPAPDARAPVVRAAAPSPAAVSVVAATWAAHAPHAPAPGAGAAPIMPGAPRVAPTFTAMPWAAPQRAPVVPVHAPLPSPANGANACGDLSAGSSMGFYGQMLMGGDCSRISEATEFEGSIGQQSGRTIVGGCAGGGGGGDGTARSATIGSIHAPLQRTVVGALPPH